MNTHHLISHIGRLALCVAVTAISAACGGELLRTGRAPVYLIIENMTATAGGGGQESAFLLSDVQVLVDRDIGGVTVQVPTTFNDVATATIRVDRKAQDVPAAPINAVTLTRYRVSFRRTDGRATPGTDVPYGFDGGLGVTIPADGTAPVSFEIIRHQAKLEPPLRNLINLGGQGFISTIAEVTFFGHDQNGNEVSVTGRIDVQFGDFGDGQ